MEQSSTFDALSARVEAVAIELSSIRRDLIAVRLEEEILGTQTVAGIVPLAQLERKAIFHAFCALKGDMLRTAALLGIGKTTLYRKMREYLPKEEHARLRAVLRGTEAPGE